jgi:type I restriction enzyme S subunit
MHRIEKLIEKLCPEGVEYKELGEIGDVTKLAGFEFTKHVTYETSGKIIALRGLNIQNYRLDLSNVKYIDKSDFSKLSRSRLFIGDLLFSYVGTIGKVAIIEENDKFYLAPNVARIRFHSAIINTRFVYYFMQTNCFWRTCVNKYLSFSSMKNLTMANIRKFSIPVPPLAIQEEIVHIFVRFFNLINLATLSQFKILLAIKSH